MRANNAATYLVVLLLIGLTGCATKYTVARLLPNAAFSTVKTYYVVRHELDKRQIDVSIAREMAAMGIHNVSSGPEINKPGETDVIVLYEDRWRWDITNYLFLLKIQFRDASSNVLIARGKTLRTSLVRKSVDEMIQETLAAVFSNDKEEMQ